MKKPQEPTKPEDNIFLKFLEFQYLSKGWYGPDTPVSFWGLPNNPHQKEIEAWCEDFIKKFL